MRSLARRAARAVATLSIGSWALYTWHIVIIQQSRADHAHRWTEQVYSSRPHLQDEPLPDAEVELFTDGSSSMLEGKRRAGYTVVTNAQPLETKALPSNTSAQRAELIALMRALELSHGKRLNIYIHTDSEYAFGVVHAIWGQFGRKEDC